MTTTARLVALASLLLRVAGAPGDPEVYSGTDNTNLGDGSVIMGGRANTVAVTATSAAVMGGDANTAVSPQSVLIGGSGNRALGTSAALETLVGGANNKVESKQATLVGGRTNRARARYSSIGGGYNNLVTGRFSGIPGGTSNTVRGYYGSCLGNFGAVRKDHGLMVNLLGTRKVLDEPNTVAMYVSKLFINGHDMDNVYIASSRRERRLDEQLGVHVEQATPASVGMHASDQVALLSSKVAELRRAVSELSGVVSDSMATTSQSRRQLRQFEAAGRGDVTTATDGTTGSMDAATLNRHVHALRAGAATARTPPQQSDGGEQRSAGSEEEAHRFLRAYYTAEDATEQKSLSRAQGVAFGTDRLLWDVGERDAVGLTAHTSAGGVAGTDVPATMQPDAWKSSAPVPERLKTKWRLARGAWRKRERARLLRRRLVNTNSDYPRDGTMAQVYQESITARMDDIDNRIATMDGLLDVVQTYVDDGDLVGEFDCVVEREAYAFGPCNICGDKPRIQYRVSNPSTSGPAVFVCDGSGVFTEGGLDLLDSGMWLQLV